jgi:hypothetical protein
VFLMLGIQDVLRGKWIGWVSLVSVVIFAGCIVIACRKALARLP